MQFLKFKFLPLLCLLTCNLCLSTNSVFSQSAQKVDSTFPTVSSPKKESGIQWVTGLSWEEVKEKAKRENKYIFLDCFTTWCGPCKMMDAEVYSNDSVGNYLNDRFLSVRVQMDRTANDNSFVKSWYSEAAAIQKKYHIEGYPTFIFI